ncbi:MAG: hypothetical protein SGBAC_010164 [Bacillariaceae sp.]
MTILGTSTTQATRIFFLLAFVALLLPNASVSAQKDKEPKEPKNEDTAPPSISNMPSFRPTAPAPSLVPTPADSVDPSSIPSAPPSPLSSDPPSGVDSSGPTEGSSDAPTTSSTAGPTDNPSSIPTDSVAPTAAAEVSSSAAPSLVSSSNGPTVGADASSPAPSSDTSETPSMEPSIGIILPLGSDSPSTRPSAMDSAGPTVSSAPSTASPSHLPTVPGASARPSNAASLSPSGQPTSTLPSGLPSSSPSTAALSNNDTSSNLECVDDPAFSNLTPDASGNVTNCDWFEFYISNSCQDFGGWSDSNGNTPNASCCVCGGGTLVSTDGSPTAAPATTFAPTVPLRCGCQSCTDEIWNRNTGTSSFTCGDRISFLMDPSGGSLSEARACYRIGHDEYPEDCKFCDSQHCILDDPAEHFHCGCPSCADAAWNADADGETCGDRIMFLQNEMNTERRKACEQVGFVEYPTQCGSCDPNSCGTARSNGVSLLVSHTAIWKTMTMIGLPLVVAYLSTTMLV